MFIIQFPILTLNKRSLQGGLLNFLDIIRPARVPGDTNVPHFSLMEVIKVEKKKNEQKFIFRFNFDGFPEQPQDNSFGLQACVEGVVRKAKAMVVDFGWF